MKRIFGIITLCLFLSNCKSSQQDKPLESGKYMIKSFAGENAEHSTYLQFDTAKNMISGQAACNGFSGSLDVKEDSLDIGMLKSTRKYCKDRMDEERKLMQNLGKVERYKYKNDQLLLLSSTGETVITTQKAKKKK